MRLPRRSTKKRLTSSQSDCVTIPFIHQEELESGGYILFIFSFLVIYSQYYCKILTYVVVKNLQNNYDTA